MRQLLTYFAAAIIVITAGSAPRAAETAADPCDLAFNPDVTAGSAQFGNLEIAADACVLGETDTTDIAAAIESRFHKGKKTPDDLVAVVDLLIEGLRPYRLDAETACRSNDPQDPANLTQACLADWLIDDVGDLRARLTSESFPVRKADWLYRNGKFGQRAVDLPLFLHKECAAIANADKAIRCATAFRFAARYYRTYQAVDEVIGVYFLPEYAKGKQFLEDRDREWSAYLAEGRPQYPWELFVNGRIYQAGLSKEQRAGFPEPPKWGLILAHPSAGIEYFEANGTKITGSLLVEVLGYSQWAWDPIAGKQKNPWGVSAIVAFADANDVNSLGYGVMIHTPIKGVSLAYVRRDAGSGHADGIFFNIDVTKLFTEYGPETVGKYFGVR